jgi:hypothetical protein
MMNEFEKVAENARNCGLLRRKSKQVYEIKLNNCCNCIVNIQYVSKIVFNKQFEFQ